MILLSLLACGLGVSEPPGSIEVPELQPTTTGRAPPPPTSTRVVVLGSGTPIPDPDRSGPCVAVVVEGVPYLVDMGPGLVRRAAAASLAGEQGVDPTRLERVFVTHLHSDHTVGLPDLLLSTWVVGRERPLQVWGPPGTRSMVDHVVAAWEGDIRVRTEGREQLDPAGARAVVQEVPAEGGVVHQDERVTVTAIPVDHGSWEHAYGYRFEARDRTIVVSGDTGPTPAIAEACSGCDVLVHEVYSKAAYDRIANPGFAAYHGSFHTSTAELAELAAQARPKLLVLYHQLFMGAPEDLLVEEIREHWGGEVVSASDLETF